MHKQQTNKSTSKPYIPKHQTQEKIHAPEITPNDDLISKLFLIVSEGNFIKVKDFVLKNHISMSVKYDNESVLHLIIKNTNITKYERFKLVNFSIMHGANVNAYDSNGITPLHLACEYQLIDTIKLLIENGANVNAQDNQNKTPLHYSIIGEHIQCPLNENKKDKKKLIPEMKDNLLDMTNLTEDNLELFKKINNLLSTDNATNKYLNVIYTILNNIENYYKYDFEKILSDIEQNLNNDPNATQNDLLNKIMDTKDSLKSFIDINLSNSLSQIPIQSNIKKGWSYDNTDKGRIIPHEDYKSILLQHIEKKYNNWKNVQIKNNNALLNLEEKINTLKSYDDMCDTMISIMMYYTQLFYLLYINGRGLTPVEEENIKNNEFSFDEYYKCFSTDFDFTNEQLYYYIMNTENNFISDVIMKEIEEYPDLTGTPPVRKNDPNLNFQNTNIWNPVGPRISKDDIFRYKKRNMRIDYNELSYDTFNIGHQFVVGGDTNLKPNMTVVYDSTNNNYQTISRIDQTYTMNVRNGQFIILDNAGNNVNDLHSIYFNFIFKFRINQLKECINKIKICFNQIDLNILSQIRTPQPNINEGFHIAYEQICKVVIEIMNIIVLLNPIIEQSKFILIKFTYMSKYISIIKALFNTNPRFSRYMFLFEQVFDYIHKIQIEFKNISSLCDNIFSSLKSLYNEMNETITYINIASSYYAITTYFDPIDDFNRFYLNDNLYPNTKNATFISQISPLDNYPESLLFLNKKLDWNNPSNVIKYMIEEHTVSITSNNSPVYLNSNIVAEINQINGYVGFDNNVYLENFNLTTPDMSPNYKAVIHIIQEINKNKNNYDLQILGTSLDVFIYMLKYSIIRYTLNFIHNNPDYNNINDVKNMILIGKYIDDTLIKYMKQLINISINKQLINIISTRVNKKNYYTIYNQLGLRDKFIIRSQNYNFSLYFDEINEEIIALQNQVNKNRTKDNMKKKISLLSFGKIEENNDNKQNEIINKLMNFDSKLNETDNMCYKVNTDVIELLFDGFIDINIKDNLGNTALFYAIEMLNIDVIKFMLSYNKTTVSTDKVKNNFNETPLLFLWNNYSNMINEFNIKKINDNDNNDSIYKIMTQTVIDEFKKRTNLDNVPKYSKLILVLCLYLLNNQLYLIGLLGSNKWSLDEHIALILELTNPQQNINTNPLIEIPYVSKLKKLVNDNKLTEYEIAHDELENIKIKKEKIDNKINNSQNQKTKLNEIIDNKSIDTIKHIVDDEIRDLTEDLNILNKNEQLLINFEMNNNKNKKIQNKDINLSNDVSEIYDEIFNKYLNNMDNINNVIYNYKTDIKTYPIVWKEYFNNFDENDYTQIIDLLQNKQIEIINDKDINIHDKIEKIHGISDYYKKVLDPYINDYFELSNEYRTDNYALDNMLNIIIHIVKRIIFVNLFGTIVKSIIKYIITIYEYTEEKFRNKKLYQKFILNIVVQIINEKKTNVNNNASTLMNYIFDILPVKIVKVILQIFSNENDTDRNETTNTLFEFINTILKSSTVLSISEQSPLLVNLKEFIYPVFITYIELYVIAMKNLIDNYLKFIQYQKKCLELLTLLNSKALMEQEQLKLL